MKCAVCNYVKEAEWENEDMQKIGDEYFIKVRGNFTIQKDRDYGYGSDIKEVSLYACPKCGTVRMEEWS